MEHGIELVGEVRQHAADVVQDISGTSLDAGRPEMENKIIFLKKIFWVLVNLNYGEGVC